MIHRIALVSFTENRRVSGLDEQTAYERSCHENARAALLEAGFHVLETRCENAPVLVRSRADLDRAFREVRDAHAVVIGAWKWTETRLAVDLVARLGLPACLFHQPDERWTGLGCASSIGASLWETGGAAALGHQRIEGDHGALVRWARGAAALSALRRKTLVLWGGSYSLRMQHLRADLAEITRRFAGDVLEEDQYLLIRRAEALLADGAAGLREFIAWLRNSGASIEPDGAMLTDAVLDRQAALYMAARMRLSELETQGEDVAGVSVHCQPALSEEWGTTGCSLPAFLPFGQDHDGGQPVVQTVCEGDVKGLLTSCVLGEITGLPALFGDVRRMREDGRDLLVVGNCGGASAYYAANSLDPDLALPALRIAPQCQGKSGGAFGYRGRKLDQVTVARLLRIGGRSLLQMGAGSAVDVTTEMVQRLGWGRTWPQVAVDLGVDMGLLARVLGANHVSMVPGDVTEELHAWARHGGVATLRLDDAGALERFDAAEFAALA